MFVRDHEAAAGSANELPWQSCTTAGFQGTFRVLLLPDRGPPPLIPSAAMEIMGVQIRTIIKDNVAVRCDGCLEVIEGTPWRVNLLDIVAAESPVAWTDRPVINPGPFQFHGDASHVRHWMASKGYLFCQKGQVREIMR